MMPKDDFVTAWTPDGKDIIFESTRDEESLTRLYRTGKYSAFVGTYDAGPIGALVVTQEGEKLIATAPNGERMELIAEPTVDKFVAQPVGAPVTFERDAQGKIVGIIVVLPGDREVKGKRMP